MAFHDFVEFLVKLDPQPLNEAHSDIFACQMYFVGFFNVGHV